MSLHDYFDRVVCMTYDRRLAAGDVTIHQELSRYGGKVDMFLMGDGYLFPAYNYGHFDVDAAPRRQAFNYGSAMLKVLRMAKTDGVHRLLYLEDDAGLTPKFEYVWPKAWAELWQHTQTLNWDLLFLGGNHVNGPVERLTNHLIRPSYTLDFHAVCFSHRAFDKLLDINPSAECTIDGVIAERQKKGLLKVLAVDPTIIIQKPGWSYNENRLDNKLDRYRL